ncbi:MAG: hypothetical protein WBB24_12970 [Maribacter sp.]
MNRYFKKWWTTLGLTLSLVIGSYGQETQNYVGPLTVGNYTGKANYDYYITETDTVYDGRFQMQRSNLETLLTKEDASFSFSGEFNKGIPEGKWKFQFGKFKSDSQSTLVDFEYQVLISGTQEEGSGRLKKGVPDGPWTFTLHRIKDSEKVATLFKSTFDYENGLPQKNFQIQNDSSTLVGRFLRNGLAHDEWSSFATQAIDDSEHWLFENGLLKQIKWIKGTQSKEIPVYTKNGSTLKTVTLDNQYLQVIKAYLSLKGEDLEEKGDIPLLLSLNSTHYDRVDKILNQLGTAAFQPNIKVQVPFYPLNPNQISQLDTIVKDVEIATDLSQSILTNSHLNILKRSDLETRYQFNAAAAISDSYLIPLKKLVDYKNNDILENLELSKVILKLWENKVPETNMEIFLDSVNPPRSFELSNAKNFDFSGNDLKAVGQMASYARLSLENIKNALSDEIDSEQRLQTLSGLEKELISLSEAIAVAMDSSSQNLPEQHMKALQAIKDFTENSLSTYAGLEDLAEKLAYGTATKTCFEQLLQLTNTIKALPEKQKDITSLYTDSIWNPFMATLMDEQVKRRITSAYSETLVPYFLNQISTSLDCELASTVTENIVYTQNRIITLRDKDTHKLERKLRREKQPKQILELLHKPIADKKQD